MNLLDWLLVVLVLAYALSGYWQGFITGAFATTGLLLGGLFGVWLAPIALGDANPSLWVSLGALFIVILSASLGQACSSSSGSRIRDRITWQPVRAVDAVGGAAAQRGRRAARRLGARRRDLRLADRIGSPRWCAARRCSAPGRRGAAGLRGRRAPGLQRRRRHRLLPALPRAVRARSGSSTSAPARKRLLQRPRRRAGGRQRRSRSAAPTAAAAASRAPASSTPTTG